LAVSWHWHQVGGNSRAKFIVADLERSFLDAGGASTTEVVSTKINVAKPVTVSKTADRPMSFGDLFRQFHADPSKVRAPKPT
jgi:hypothetical protein